MRLVDQAPFRRLVTLAAVVAAGAAAWLFASFPSGGGRWPGLVIAMLPSTAFLVAVTVLWVRQSRGPARTVGFVVDRGAFRTRVTAEAVWWPAVITVAFTGMVVSLLRSTWDEEDPAWQLDVVDIAVTAVLGVAAVLLLATQLVNLLTGRPGVELTPAGVTVGSPFGHLTVPWEGLRPGYPLRPAPRDAMLSLAVARKDLTRRRGLGTVFLRWIDVNPLFLTDVIRYYVDHPEHRAAIGTTEEHDRLTTSLGLTG
ncbi:hypothetical protein [Asanoa siamensis]|uniref:PH domain-containing protein n=1 Tax=Asanoa siamensis TaxID=926357 RepID=A0ABQ4CX72_9ACTN|nr:hypothetical protein [Asanoa siamensis]GIF75608.1 hypothetical protein Asi02nite_51260 [Asanoa siamensis]